MKVLFLGGVFPKDQEDMIYRNSKGIVQTAANQLQWNLIYGIENILQKGINIISSAFIGYYPSLYSRLFIKAHNFSHRAGSNDYAIGFINLKGLEIFHRALKLYRPVKKWLRQNNKDEGKLVVLVYSAQVHFLHIVKRIKKDFGNVHICIIVPDLPEYMVVTSKKTFARYIYNKFMKNTLNRIVYENMKYADSFVILTKYMKEPLDIGARPYVVVEGIAGNYPVYANKMKILDSRYKNVVYTGTLARKYGIMDLVNGFMKIKGEGYRLNICGAGDACNEIVELSLKDSRIIYMGSLKHEEVLQIQSEAAIVVNPRRNGDEYTRYSFPSKTIEYLLSGRPVLMHRLDGIPANYDDYIMYFEQWPDKTIAEIIVEVCEREPSQLNEFGKKAREYVLQYKNPTSQGRKILDMIENSLNKM